MIKIGENYSHFLEQKNIKKIEDKKEETIKTETQNNELKEIKDMLKNMSADILNIKTLLNFFMEIVNEFKRDSNENSSSS